MNLFLKEIRNGIKTYLLWMLGLFFLIFAGMVKYTGFRGDTSIMVIFEQFPRVVLAVFGMVGVDISKLGGYYSMLANYVMFCASIYGIHLGTGAVTRENIDHTYEFLFTKPRSRREILRIKLLAGIFYLLLFVLAEYGMTLGAISVLDFQEDITQEMFLFSIVIFLMGLLFMMLASLITALIQKNEKGMRYANLTFFVFFLSSTLYDMLDKGGILKLLAPFKYFAAWDLVKGTLDVSFVCFTLFLIIVFYRLSLRYFEKKDMII